MLGQKLCKNLKVKTKYKKQFLRWKKKRLTKKI